MEIRLLALLPVGFEPLPMPVEDLLQFGRGNRLRLSASIRGAPQSPSGGMSICSVMAETRTPRTLSRAAFTKGEGPPRQTRLHYPPSISLSDNHLQQPAAVMPVMWTLLRLLLRINIDGDSNPRSNRQRVGGWWSRRESNPDLRIRNPPFYPLNYGTNL